MLSGSQGHFLNRTTPPSLENIKKARVGWYDRIALKHVYSLQFSSVQSLSHVQLFVTPWIAARQASLSITNSRSLFKLMSTECVMPSNHLNLHRPLLLPPSIFSSIRVFSNESLLPIRWPQYWSFSFSISPSNEYSGLISLGWTSLVLQPKGLSRVFQHQSLKASIL